MADARVIVDAILNAAGVTKGVNQIKGQVNGISWKNLEKGDGVASKVAGGLKTAGAAIGKALVAGTAAAATGVAAIGKAALDSYATYEQLVGGVETLFGTRGAQSIQEYAEIVGRSVGEVGDEYASHQRAQEQAMQNASQAFRTAGMSANDYMEQTTSFAASLVTSLGGDTEKAVSYADTAVQDMADNANKMGTDIGRITDAYQGFAKQNYTMLDNLKLGYGGTKTEMERLLADAQAIKAAHGEMAEYSVESFADIVEAIHVVQDEMGITGTTQKEAAETIEGSINMTKAAYANWLTGLADDNADFGQLTQDLVESAMAAFNNIMPRLQTVSSTLIAALPSLFQTLAGMVGQLLPPLVDAAVDAVVALVDTVTGMLARADFSEAGRAVVQKAVEVFSKVAPALMELLPQLAAAGGELMAGVAQGIVEAVPGAADVVQGAVDVFGPALQNLAGFFEHVAQAAGPLLAQAIAIMQPALESAAAWFGAVLTALSPVAEFLTGLLAPAFDVVAGTVLALLEVLSAFVQDVSSAFQAAWQAVGGFVELVSPVGEVITGAFNGVGDFISGQFDFGKAEASLDGLADSAESAAGDASGAFDGIGDEIGGEFELGGAEDRLSSLEGKAGSAAEASGAAFSGIGGDISGEYDLSGAEGSLDGLESASGEAAEASIEAFDGIGESIGDQFEFEGAHDSLAGLESASGDAQAGVTEAFSGIGAQVSGEFDMSGAEASLAQLGQAGGETPPQIVDSFSGGAGQMDSAAQQFFEAVPRAADESKGKAQSAAQECVRLVVSAFQGGRGQMYSAGVSLIQGAESGVRAQAAALARAAAQAVTDAVNAAKAAADIHSPSKKMEKEVGKPLAQGAAKGVTANKDLLAQAVKGMLEDTTNKTEKQVAKAANSLSTSVAAAYKKITKAGYDSYAEYAKQQREWEKLVASRDKKLKAAGLTWKTYLAKQREWEAKASAGKSKWDDATKSAYNSFKKLEKSLKGWDDKTVKSYKQFQKLAKSLKGDAASLKKYWDLAAVSLDLGAATKAATKNTKVLENLYKRTGLSFSESFVEAFMNGSEEYQKVFADMAKMTDKQVAAIVEAFEKQERAERNEALSARKLAVEYREQMLSVGRSAKDAALDATEAALDMREALVSVKEELAESTKTAVDKAAAIGKLSKLAGVAFTESFVEAVLKGGEDYEKTLLRMGSMTEAQVNELVAAYSSMEAAQRKEGISEREWALSVRQSMAMRAKGAEEMALDVREAVLDVREAVAGDASLSSALQAANVSADDLARMVGSLGVAVDDFASGVQAAAQTVSDGFNRMARDSQTSLEDWRGNLLNNINEANEYAVNLATVMNNIPDDIDSEAFRKAVYEGGYEKFGQMIADLATKSGEEIAEAIALYNESVAAGQQAAVAAFESLAMEPPDIDELKKAAKASQKAMGAVEDAAEEMEETVSEALGQMETAASKTFKAVAAMASDNMDEAVRAVEAGVSQMASTLRNANLAFPHIKVPHFSVRGDFSIDPPSVPTFNVNWYAKGGIFNGPSVIGVGERAPEMVLPSSGPMMDEFAERVAAKAGGGATVTVYIDRFENNTEDDIDELADRVADAVDRKIAEKTRIKAYA